MAYQPSTRTESHSSCDHWTECDRPSCPNDGAEHVRVDGFERPLWLCRPHAQAARTEQR